MKILMIQRFDLSSVSCARRILCQAEQLARRGHKVILTDFIHPARQKELPPVARPTDFGAELISLPRGAAYIRANILRLRRIEPAPEVVHLWKAYPDASLPAIALARHWNIPLHYDWDDWERGIAEELTGSAWAGWIAGRWDRLMPSLCDGMTAASAFLRQTALRWGARADRLWDAPVGADVDRFHPREKDAALAQSLQLGSPVLTYHGQLEVASYAEQAVEALVHVRREFPQAALLIVGGGRKLPAIRARAEALGVADRVRFTDYIAGDEVPRYLALADLALAPFEENDVTRAKSPLKIAEYLAMGLPVVASHVGEAPVMLNDAGICTPCGDAASMANEAVKLLNDAETRHRMGAAGRRFAESKYNWSTHADSLEEAYRIEINAMRS